MIRLLTFVRLGIENAARKVIKQPRIRPPTPVDSQLKSGISESNQYGN